METTAPSRGTEASPSHSGRLPRNVAYVVAVLLIAAIVGAAIYAVQSNQGARSAQSLYQQQNQQLSTALAQARSAGYTAQDLQSITTRQKALAGGTAPALPWGKTGYYQDRAVELAQLRGSLQGVLPKVLSDARSTVTQDIGTAQTLMQQNQAQGGDETPLQQQVGQVQQSATQAVTIAQVRAVETSAQKVVQGATAQAATLKQETAAIQQGATQLLAQTQDVPTLQKDGQAALTAGRNDASIAAYEGKAGRFGPIDQLMASYDRLEYFASQLSAATPAAAAFAAAAELRYNGQIHAALIANLGPQHIIVDFTAQHVYAYQNGQVVMDTAATSGVRGVTTDGTDFGPMKIIHKDHPWTMHSPWPKGSPLWYPDTPVAYASFFTNSGESFHDASWEPDSALGPGSQFAAAYQSHG
ncbi:MAG: L,D-transpeptidase, partial [Candidatus Dormiibacterota bacterium]